VNEDKALVSPEAASQQAIQSTSHSDSEISEDKVSCDKPLLDVLMLLKNCDLEPSYLMQNETRKVIEDNLSKRQGPLPAEHLAVMQLISKAEIESGLSMDSRRKSLLEKRIKEGPLNAAHLNAVPSLRQVDGGNLPQMGPIVPADAGVVGQLNVAGLDHELEVKQHESCKVPNSVSAVAAGHGDLAKEIRAPFFIDTISGLEVKTSLLSREEKSALQLMELRAKTARILQSLPEWVKNGLVPPRLNRKPSPPANYALAESLANVADWNAGNGAVQISCSVQADLGFLKDFSPTAAQARLQQDALESLFLKNVEQNVDIATDEQQPVQGWQVGPSAEEVLGPGLSPMPPLTRRIGSSLAWFSSYFAECVSCFLRAVLGACSSGLGCLICLVKRPGPGNRD
jgi:hypothetical protein